MPFYLNAEPLKPFIPNDLMVLLQDPKMYRHSKGGGVAMGLVATALPQVCNVWLAAREAHYRGEIKLSQHLLDVALRAEILMRGLAVFGRKRHKGRAGQTPYAGTWQGGRKCGR